jgi:hypothetical protein
MPSREAVIAALVAETRPALDRNGWAKNSCLPATRIGIDILNSYGIEAHALSVTVVAMNPTAAAMKSSTDPIPEGAPPPTVVEIAYQGANDPWSGHCVILADHDIVDLTIDQIDKPSVGLTVAPMAFPAPEGFGEGKVAWLQRNDGCKIGYRNLPDDKAYATAADWADLEKMKPLRLDLERAVAKQIGPAKQTKPTEAKGT